MNHALLSGKHLLFRFLRSRWSAALLSFLLDLLASICVIGLPFLFTQVIALLLGFHSIRGNLFGLQSIGIEALMGWIAGIIFIKFGLDYTRFWVRGRLSEDFAHQLRLLAFQQHLGTDARYYESREPGRSLLRFSGDLGSAQRLLTHGVLQFSADLTLLLLAFGLIIGLHWFLGLVIIGLGAFSWYLTLRVNWRLRAMEQRRRSSKAGLLSFVNFTLQQLPSIQTFNRSARTAERFEKKSEQVRVLGHQYRRLEAFSVSIPTFFIQMLLLGVLLLGWKLGLSFSALFMIVLVLMSCRNAWVRLLKSGLIREKGLLSLEKLALLLSPPDTEPPLRLSAKQAQTLKCSNLTVQFGPKTVLNALNFQLSVGESLCLNLPTGAGKTVLAKTIAGHYRPDQGQILWNNLDAVELSRHNLRQQVAFVSDAFPLIGRNLMEAINPNSKTSATTEATFRAWQAQFPALHGLELHQKMNKKESGISAGQQRLLQFLHALLTNKPFLVLDDAFSVLDAPTIQTLIKILNESCTQKGVLILSSNPEILLEMGWNGLQIKN